MTKGDRVVYRSLSGHDWAATVVAVQTSGPKVASIDPDVSEAFPGSLDLAVDAGCNDPVQLTRIELVPRGKLRPGTCAREGD